MFTTTLTTTTVVEHKFQVGDVIDKGYFGGTKRYTIEAISMTNPSGARDDGPFYIYDGSHRFDHVSSIDNPNRNITLVGGPRFVPPYEPKWKVGDVISTFKGDTTIEGVIESDKGLRYQLSNWATVPLCKSFDNEKKERVLIGGPRFVPSVPTKLEILKSARQLIVDPDKWGKGKFKQGGHLCALGAIYTAAGSPTADGSGLGSAPLYQAANAAREAVEQAVGRQCLWMWNDATDRTHEQVLAAFDVAIGQEVLAS